MVYIMRCIFLPFLFTLLVGYAAAQTGTLFQQLTGKETAGLSVQLVWDYSCPNAHVTMTIQGPEMDETIRLLPQLSAEQLYTHHKGQDFFKIESVEQIPGDRPDIRRIDTLGQEIILGKRCQKYRVSLASEEMILWVWADESTSYYGHLAPYFPSSREFQALALGKWPGIIWQSEVRDFSGNLISSLKVNDFQQTKPSADRFAFPKDLRPVYVRKAK